MEHWALKTSEKPAFGFMMFSEGIEMEHFSLVP